MSASKQLSRTITYTKMIGIIEVFDFRPIAINLLQDVKSGNNNFHDIK